MYPSFLSHSFIHSFSAFWDAVVTTPPISVVMVGHGNIQGKEVQWVADSFCIEDVEVNTSLLSDFFPSLTGEVSDL